MEKREKEVAENLAFAFCKTEMLEIFEKNEESSTTIFSSLGVNEKQLDDWFKEIKENKELVSSSSKTRNVQLLLSSSSSLQEFCGKIILFYGIREQIIEASADPVGYFAKTFLKK